MSEIKSQHDLMMMREIARLTQDKRDMRSANKSLQLRIDQLLEQEARYFALQKLLEEALPKDLYELLAAKIKRFHS